MKNLYLLHKPVGLTPLEALKLFRQTNSELADTKLSYIGRLDPMARGLLLILENPTFENRENLKGLPKTYQVEILFGLATDTYDALGLITQNSSEVVDLNQTELTKAIQKYIGTFDQPYPPYSSAKVNGKALFEWAKLGQLDQIEIPQISVTINRIQILKIATISKSDLLENVEHRINLVTGDFRQGEILNQWRKTLSENLTQTYPVVTIEVNCSSGTYMRSLAHNLGRDLNIPAIAFDIFRTQVGDYSIDQAIHLPFEVK